MAIINLLEPKNVHEYFDNHDLLKKAFDKANVELSKSSDLDKYSNIRKRMAKNHIEIVVQDNSGDKVNYLPADLEEWSEGINAICEFIKENGKTILSHASSAAKEYIGNLTEKLKAVNTSDKVNQSLTLIQHCLPD